MPLLNAAFWLQVALACGNGADPRLVDALLEHESGGNPNAVHLNKNGTIDAGGMQVNQINWERFHLDRQTALDPCRSVDAGTQHLIADGGPDAVKPATVDALLRAIGKYNPGDPTYKDKIVGIMARNADVSPAPATKPSKPKQQVSAIVGRPRSQRSVTAGR